MRKRRLKSKMVEFWNKHEGYFQSARAANINYSDEAHEYHRKALEYIPKGAMVLDVGCGTAEVGRDISRFAQYYGIDVSRIALLMGKEYLNASFNMVQGDIANMPFHDETFDVILSLYSLEHFVEVRRTLEEMDRVLKVDGIMIFVSPAYDSPSAHPPSITFSLGGIDQSTYKRKILLPLDITVYVLKRTMYASRQLLRQINLYFNGKAHDFNLVSEPKCLNTEYVMDSDVTYIVSIREVRNWLCFSKRYRILEISRGPFRFPFVEFFFVPTLFILTRKT